jgi:hypothetical protein
VPRDLGRSPWAESCGSTCGAAPRCFWPRLHSTWSRRSLEARALRQAVVDDSDRSGGTTLVCDRAQRRRTPSNDGSRDAHRDQLSIASPVQFSRSWRRDAPSSRTPADCQLHTEASTPRRGAIRLWEKANDSAATRSDLRARTTPHRRVKPSTTSLHSVSLRCRSRSLTPLMSRWSTTTRLGCSSRRLATSNRRDIRWWQPAASAAKGSASGPRLSRARGNPSLLMVRAGRHAATPARIQACSTVAVEF